MSSNDRLLKVCTRFRGNVTFIYRVDNALFTSFSMIDYIQWPERERVGIVNPCNNSKQVLKSLHCHYVRSTEIRKM